MSLMQHTQLFRGPIYVSDYPKWIFEEIFKLQNVVAEPVTNEITISDPTRLGLPPLDTVNSTSEITINAEAVAFSPRAAAIATYGSVTQVPSGDVVDEAHDAYIDRVIMLAHIPLEVDEVTSADGVTTYTRNVDYAVVPAGIRILPGGPLATAIAATTPPAGELKRLPIKVSYSYPTVDVIKPFITGQKFYRVMTGQINEGGSNERRRIQCFYCKISLNGGIPLNQGQEFGTIPVMIKLLADPAIFDVGEASMWQWEVENKDVA
ncbi:hypothetical protein NUV66_06395 [Pseudomonas sp. 32.2.56]|uniref:hypothetical protein n=1 Tax=Pseudomonas sp. 32.2.56 TaxID=2969303 RepID=UPI00214FB77D|nr:hypothetical protein [Pseudomonas sp. 32.2.56]MCR4508929.1 hypothetical protein [Pseudomonas sp. 32.2.56]